MAAYHTTQEEATLRALSTRELAKKNNKMLNEAIIADTPEKKLKHDECRLIIREELATRGILSSSSEERLIDGTELV